MRAEDFVAGPRIHFGRKMEDPGGRRIDAEFNGNLHFYRAPLKHVLLSCPKPLTTPFLHDCLTPKLPLGKMGDQHSQTGPN